MKVLILVLSVLFMNTSQASAVKTCVDRLQSLKTGRVVAAKISPDTYKFAAKALKHYRSDVQAGANEYPARIESVKRYAISGFAGWVYFGTVVSISDGGDESSVDYFYDKAGKLVYGKLNNQSPENYWFCEK